MLIWNICFYSLHPLSAFMCPIWEALLEQMHKPNVLVTCLSFVSFVSITTVSAGQPGNTWGRRDRWRKDIEDGTRTQTWARILTWNTVPPWCLAGLHGDQQGRGPRQQDDEETTSEHCDEPDGRRGDQNKKWAASRKETRRDWKKVKEWDEELKERERRHVRKDWT